MKLEAGAGSALDEDSSKLLTSIIGSRQQAGLEQVVRKFTTLDVGQPVFGKMPHGRLTWPMTTSHIAAYFSAYAKRCARREPPVVAVSHHGCGSAQCGCR